MTLVSGLFAVLFYTLGSIFQGMSITGKTSRRSSVYSFGSLAVLAHLISAIGVIRTTSGYHFGIAEISTLITASISLLVLISSLRKPLENLFIGLFPLAILTILVSLTISSNYPPTEMNLGLALHVLVSILAYSFFTIAALQATFVAYQNNQLKGRQTHGVIRKFPPLQDMEAFLFELLWVGEILLTLGMLVGVVFVADFWQQDGVAHKTVFSVLAWFVFGVLLWGRTAKGWRGTTAIRWTLTGFVFLLLGFYGSKFVIEYVLS